MRQSLNGRANRCANNTRTFERAGSAVIGAPRYFVNESALTSWFRKSEPRAHENPNLWNMKIRIIRTRKSESSTPENPNFGARGSGLFVPCWCEAT